MGLARQPDMDIGSGVTARLPAAVPGRAQRRFKLLPLVVIEPALAPVVERGEFNRQTLEL